jgi:transposase
MCLKPQPPRPMPPEIAAWGANHLAEDDPYKLIGDLLYEDYHDQDFAELYHKEGKPALSPVMLALVLVFQALENLPDRKTAEAVEVNLKWKYALHLPLDASSFDASVLSDFRKRLLDHHAEAQVFDQVLVRMQALGLLTPHGIQHTDSLSLLSRARDLGRLELVFETLRASLRALLKADAEWLRAAIPADWATRYRHHCRTERHSDEERAFLTGVIGDDGQHLLDLVDAAEAPAALKELHMLSVLRTIWQQQFETVDGHVQFRPKGGIGGGARIETPYDDQARWSEKRGAGWVGYKLQVTETDDADTPHLITDIAVTPATQYDTTALPDIRERQQARGVLPSERYGDSGYISGTMIAEGRLLGEELIGPMRTTSTPQSRMENGLTHADFQIDFHAGQVICPGGQTTLIISSGSSGQQAVFPRKICADCPLRSRCCTGKTEGRTLHFQPHYAETQEARARQETPAFKEAYRQHRPEVEGCLSALVRGHGIRVCRYSGQAKNHLRALFVGVAVNPARAAAWLAGRRHRPKRQGLALAVPAGG